MQIQVTQKDIERGIRNNSQSCPIALALSRRLKGRNVRLEVDLEKVYFWNDQGKLEVLFGLPENAQKFVSDFDRGSTVQPFQFQVDWQPPKKHATS